ncbi:hypothetical protein [Bradyrhizobium sp. USDA 329]|uniref:hypothetical protein n=1 Tax=unclassified Bradyrhizobium TaxID=2631580 RepID=UPI0035164741
MALSSLSEYAQESAETLGNLVDKCDDETLPRLTATEELVRPLPADTLKTLSDFIEYTDHGEVRILEALIAAIQVHDARLRGIYSINNDPNIVGVVIRADLEGRIVDAASIYAGAAVFYNYARRRSNELPTSVPWENVAVALSNMRIWDSEYPRVYETLERQRSFSTGPFDLPSDGTA